MPEPLIGKRIKIRSRAIRGYRLNVFDGGNPNGQPVVFIHGLTGSLQGWANQIQHLQASGKFRLIAYDVDGHGRSDHQAGISIPRQADDFNLLLGRLNVTGPIFLVGHSIGGMLAQQFTFDHPDRVAKLALISSAPEFPEDARHSLNEFLDMYKSKKYFPPLAAAYYRGLMRHLQREFSEPKPVSVKTRLELPPASSVENHLRQYLAFHAPVLSENQRPETLILWADGDSLFGSSQDELRQRWSGPVPARMVVLSDSRSHLPQIDHPTRVNKELASFLASPSPLK